MLKTYEYRMYPTEAQKVLLNKHFGAARYVYNWGLAIKEIGAGCPECTLVETWVTGSRKQELELEHTFMGVSKG